MSCTHILPHKCANIAAQITFVTILLIYLDPLLLLYDPYMKRILHICKNFPKNQTKKHPFKTLTKHYKGWSLGFFFKTRTPERNPELILSTTIAYRHTIFQRQNAKVPSGDHILHHCTVMPEPHEYPAHCQGLPPVWKALMKCCHLSDICYECSRGVALPCKLSLTSLTRAHGHTCHTNKMPSWHDCDVFRLLSHRAGWQPTNAQ